MVLKHLILVLTLLASPLNAAPFKSLFNGTSLDGWTPVGDANWTLKDGLVSADKGAISFLVSKERFRDFELRVEFWVSEDANSGIFIRCVDAAPRMELDNAYEVNIFDTRPDPTYGTGAIVTVAKVSPMPKAGGHWNTYLIRAEGDHGHPERPEDRRRRPRQPLPRRRDRPSIWRGHGEIPQGRDKAPLISRPLA